MGVLVRLDRIKPGEDHGLDFLESRKRLDRGPGFIGDGVADLAVGNVLDISDDETDLTSDELINLYGFGSEYAESFHIEGFSVPPQADLLSALQGPLKDAHQHNDPAVRIKPGIKDQRLQMRVG